jgi:uncharacterized protein (DUF1786 family)
MGSIKSSDISDGILAIDVGSGTQDILIWKPGISVENCPKLVVPSATTIIAHQIAEATKSGKAIFLSGTTMGGGPCSASVRKHIESGFEVYSLTKPALTFNDDIDKVKTMGVKIVKNKPDVSSIVEIGMGDIHLDNLKIVLNEFRIALPGFIAVSVQDHGYSPKESNRAFRFKLWKSLLEGSTGGMENLLYENPPDYLNRMKAVQEIAPKAWLMDTGASAILGALTDKRVEDGSEEGVTIVNAGNEHTVAALIKNEKVWGIYEHHTSMLDSSKLKDHLVRFRRGRLPNIEIFNEMGHGCIVLPEVGKISTFPNLSFTGPNREKFKSLGGHMAAPFGDMMLTGCFGLVEAVKRKIAS